MDHELLDPREQPELSAPGGSLNYFLSSRAYVAQGELGDAHVLHPLEPLELHALDLLELLDLELLQPSEQLDLLAPGGSPYLCFCRRATVRGAGRAG